MFVVIMVTFFQWTREKSPSASMGWLETARRAAMADRIAEANPGGAAVMRLRERETSGAARNTDVDEDETQLAAYNEYLARINGHNGSGPDES
jgi:hypothetical protein